MRYSIGAYQTPACRTTKTTTDYYLTMRDIFKENIEQFENITVEYIKHSGKLMAIDNIHTNIILTVTRFRVLFRPKRIGQLNDKYRSIDIVHKCIILAVQNNTSKQIHTKQWTESNGKYPVKNKREEKNIFEIRNDTSS